MVTKSETGRLPLDVSPESYAIALSLFLDQKSFSGTVCITLTLNTPLKNFRLHALGLQVDQVKIGSIRGDVTLDPTAEMILLSFPTPIPKGEAKLSLNFAGVLNRQMRGLYETESHGETFAFTQFQATDARRMFPCFDEPGMKASFSLSVTVPADLVALSNMPIIEEQKLGEFKQVVFEETPIMSTYLLALAVARLEKKEIQVGKTTVAVWTLPSQLSLGQFALKVTASVLPLLNDYFNLPCPTPKLDLVCVPDFAMGAMENWGAIFFRDSCLLLDEPLSSTATQQRVASIITHEIVHQWFGNLVTMHWWDDLWLNESFATWLACKIVDQWRPEWDFWSSFQQEKELPLALDALDSSRPIHSDVVNASEIEEMFDVLTYEKGGACLRMIEQYLGESCFRDGVQRYIKRYQYKNATASDLWSVLEEVSQQPVLEIAQDWFSRPGFPIVKMTANGDDFSDLRLSQNRFKAGAPKETPPWPIPFIFKFADDRGLHTQKILFNTQETSLRLSAKGRVQWVFGNAKEVGFYRMNYDANLLQSLPAVVAKQLDPAEKIGFLSHLWALIQRGDLPVSFFMETLFYFRGDSTHVLVADICSYLETLSQQIVFSSDQKRFSAFVDQQLNPAWEKLGWDTAPNESAEGRLARADLLWALGAIAQDERILSELPRRQSRYLARPSSLDPTLATPLLRLCAYTDGGKRFEQFLDKFKRSKSPETRDQYLLALCDFNKPALARRVIDFSLSKQVRSQDVWKPIRALLGKRMVQAEAWNYLKIHWLSLKEKGGSIGAQRMIQSTKHLWSPEWYEEVADFFKKPENSSGMGERTLAQTLEFIQQGIQFKKQQSSSLSAWLKENSPEGLNKVF